VDTCERHRGSIDMQIARPRDGSAQTNGGISLVTTGNFVTERARRRRPAGRCCARCDHRSLAPQLLSRSRMRSPIPIRIFTCLVVGAVAAGCVAPPKKKVAPTRPSRAAAPLIDPSIGALPPASDKIVKMSAFTAYIPREDEVPGVVGANELYRVAAGRNLLDIAREGGLGFRELRDANPRIDEWEPKAGVELVLPTRRILPRPNRYSGLVINIPEFRLYMFPVDAKLGERAPVMTWPVGLGAEWAPSPIQSFHVKSKDEKPTWVVPDSIYAKMEDPKRVVPPGPDNPLGDYRIRLDFDLYAIHGTNDPWTVGRLTTHGCVRLYPEDIEYLYPLVDRGYPGEFVYQPVKIGERKGRVFVEVHRDVYEMFQDLGAHARGLLARARLDQRVDPDRLAYAVEQKLGVPIDVTRDGAQADAAPANPQRDDQLAAGE
jgi:L,D-transpeptidase ErfK/SrfK